LGLLQRNKDFQTPLEQANKMVSRFLLFCPSFTKETSKKFTDFFPKICKYAPMLYTANVGLCDYALFLQIQSHFKATTIDFTTMCSAFS